MKTPISETPTSPRKLSGRRARVIFSLTVLIMASAALMVDALRALAPFHDPKRLLAEPLIKPLAIMLIACGALLFSRGQRRQDLRATASANVTNARTLPGDNQQ